MELPKISYKKIIDVLSENNLLVEHNIKNLDEEIEFISYNSMDIVKNTLFFCKGAHFKEEYLFDAIKKGAVCYDSEQKYDLKDYDCNYIIVSNIRLSIAIIAPLYYNYAYKDLNLIGVTGTKGKTMTAYFIRNIMNEFTQSETGLSSNIEKYTGKRSEEAHINTPEPCDLQQYFYEAKESGIKYFTMEVSSQAYKTDRVHGIKFDNGIFINIGEDHISPAEHENFEDYFSCKLEFIKNCANIVINRETDFFERVLETAESSPTLKQITLFGSEKAKDKCDYYYSDVKKEKNGDEKLTFYIKNDKINYCQKFAIKTFGLFNVENAAAAVTMCKTLGVDDESIRKGLIKTEIPGRMTIFENNGVTVIVDYAHNLLSFTKLYESLKLDYPGRKIISVGGAPGNKALKRRKDFADTIGVNSDYVYLTEDDPQYEDAVKICEEIAGYMPPEARYEIVPDRTEAVRKAIRGAKSGDVVVLLAKGAETYIKSNGKLEPYKSDLKLAQEELKL
ncbi:MAG: UDP-N-acetylmuramoyl-L-alanyl-D-glutamate--2,6-diaminopimelate ligase [Oscillospiraceae bacterium]|nr:UDP-N-acetylmuramoyl-L-alanyl-D-glutamate--2,6-diaminopimelate ligase [Oscillospiraceae bacterium]